MWTPGTVRNSLTKQTCIKAIAMQIQSKQCLGIQQANIKESVFLKLKKLPFSFVMMPINTLLFAFLVFVIQSC